MRLSTGPLILYLAAIAAGAAINYPNTGDQALASQAEALVSKRDPAEKRQDVSSPSWTEEIEAAIEKVEGALEEIEVAPVNTGPVANGENSNGTPNGCIDICLPFLGCQVVCT